MQMHNQFFVKDPTVVRQAPYSGQGNYHADLAIVIPVSFSLFYAVGIGENKSSEQSSFEHSLNQAMRQYQSLKRHFSVSGCKLAQKLANTTFFPSFLFTIVKKKFNLYGVTTHSEHGQEKISHALLCSCSSKDDKSKFDELAFRLKSGMRAIEKFIESIKAGEASSSFPVVKPDGYPELEYVYVMNSRVFEAKECKDGPVSCVVKFVSTRYPKEVHEHCYENGIAPKFQVEVADGYSIVVMEKVKEAMNLDEYIEAVAAGSSCAHYQRVIGCLERALHILHSKGYVHGDFRGPNILVCSDGSVKFVDFDWSGKQGKRKYKQLGDCYVWPCFQNSELSQCHDLYFLAGYKRKIHEAATRL